MNKLQQLLRYEQTAGVLMIAAIAIGLGAANSPLAPLYELIHDTEVHLRFGALIVEDALAEWVNQGLMVIFFLIVGLEIKRELLEGDLASLRYAALPAIAAVGGMLAPALIYAGFNWDDAAALRGWAIPTATDIVLAVSLLSLLGSRVPAGLKIFLTALAIFDDIGAVLVIAVFYGDALALTPLLVAALAVAGLIVVNRMGITREAAYVIPGLILWVALLKAGVEAALAGVLIAAAVPLRIPRRDVASPLKRTERRLHPWSTLVVVPLFAFFNAGIVIDAASAAQLLDSVSLGIIAGLFLGKQLGILVACWAAVVVGLGQLPKGVTWAQIYGAAVLAGIGFTMSLFVATLAFSDPVLVTSAKLAILVASLLAGVFGLSVIGVSTRAPAPAAQAASGSRT
ncbi:pH-dependent sodium/proton antiporter [Salinisphaera shabanensis T35B1]|jgi:NhaA family Na+:H+ antiporter|uniref:Na(+)/H(+) antiporter NhaA n=1 Tax=Salinisphaera shabanensis E1L3A TaxID=1033802 RepID=U2EPU1_9GAMM|nr:Na+/H+ antiporter NhaA [Salinisphaera shabanensis]ERJ19825.1 Na antiporter NhaA protein [Salinisphaera shabanensis E1L3A]